MVKYIKSTEYIFGMANLTPKRTGLLVDIWSDHNGISRKVSHKNSPRVKIGRQGQFEISITIEPDPKIKAKSSGITQAQLKDCQPAVDYVGRNSDVFLKHYMDTKDEFDDDDLKDALKQRGEYK